MALFRKLNVGDWQPPNPAKLANPAKDGAELSQLSQLSQSVAGCQPRAVEALRRLAGMARPSSCDRAAWRRMVNDASKLVEGGWGAKAFALGWSEVDLFGIAKDQDGSPGLAAWLSGDEVTAISDAWAVVRTPEGGRRYLNRPVVGAVLPWML